MLNNKIKLLLVLLLLSALHASAVPCKVAFISNKYTLTDTPSKRLWWDVQHYIITLMPDYRAKYIKGQNQIKFMAVRAVKEIQLDLQQPMRITKVMYNQRKLLFKRTTDGSYSIEFPTILKAGTQYSITVGFEGKPKEALDPPVDNGWIWSKDEKGRPWISVACEGSGASIWLPCKDELSDEPDEGATMAITVPDTLVAVSNGRLRTKKSKDGLTTYTWVVTSPINSYNLIPYIGKYITWRTTYNGEGGKLDRDFWVLDYNLAKGKKHFTQTDTMLRAFEYWLGPYPFYADSYKLVEAPLPGMEHQSAVAYGNGFQNGYRGKDFISRSGWGLKWDFMMVHESGHEWFGNSITASSYGDTWIHEGFTKYLETLYTDYVFGTKAGNEYAVGTWKRIKNDQPILGTNTSDKYYKGSAMLHMIRLIVGDAAFKQWLRGLNQQYYHKVVNTNEVISLLGRYTNKDLAKIFDQYLRTTQIPALEYHFKDDEISYRWSNCIDGFNMPLKVNIGGRVSQWIFPTTQWQSVKANSGFIKADANFLVTLASSL